VLWAASPRLRGNPHLPQRILSVFFRRARFLLV
jgi:hypothetical protein